MPTRTSISALAASLSSSVGLDAAVSAAIQSSLRQVGGAVRAKATATDTVQVLMVAEPERIQVGLVTSGGALAFAATDPLLADLRKQVTEVKHVALAKGHLLALTRKA